MPPAEELPAALWCHLFESRRLIRSPKLTVVSLEGIKRVWFLLLSVSRFVKIVSHASHEACQSFPLHRRFRCPRNSRPPRHKARNVWCWSGTGRGVRPARMPTPAAFQHKWSSSSRHTQRHQTRENDKKAGIRYLPLSPTPGSTPSKHHTLHCASYQKYEGAVKKVAGRCCCRR